MPDYVYALHDFVPEHEDEVSFRAGERIEVVEKDDLYQDGWWQGRNLAGRVGLFPQSYTTPAPPTPGPIVQSTSTSSTGTAGTDITVHDDPHALSKQVLHPLREESESGSTTGHENGHIVAPIPKTPAILFNGEEEQHNEDAHNQRNSSAGTDGEVMKATMTDVQKAIEQLGRGSGDADGARSFSFASTRDGRDTEEDTDFDMSDVDAGDGDADPGGEDWHKGARRKLAEKARRAVEEAEKLEAMINSSERRLVVPPIEVELSDESDESDDDDHEEGDHTRTSGFQRDHPYIPEEDEEEATKSENEFGAHAKDLSVGDSTTVTHASTPGHSANGSSTQVSLPERVDESELKTATAAQSTFAVPQSPPRPLSEQQLSPPAFERPVSPPQISIPIPTSPAPQTNEEDLSVLFPLPGKGRSKSPVTSQQSKNTTVFPVVDESDFRSSPAIPTLTPKPSTPPAIPAQSQSTPVPPFTTLLSPISVEEKKDKHPTDWSLDEVVEWLKSKNFGQDVCDKFIEQEITGDVLLELNVELLKTEIGIAAFGKRLRIANAITDLRRPPSIIYSDHIEPSSPTHTPHSRNSNSHLHSRTQSQSQSHHSFPGTSAHTYSQSMQSSLGSPLGGGFAFGTTTTTGHSQGTFGGVAIVESPMQGASEYNGGVTNPVLQEALMMNEAGQNGKGLKPRPAQLTLSPSDGALKSHAQAVLDVQEHTEEDRGHMSEGEMAPTNVSMRRRLFGRSHDSTHSSRHSSKESPIPSPNVTKESFEKEHREKDTGSRHARAKKSIDGGRGSERLSIFGGTFGGTLGKSRKPAPRYSGVNEEAVAEKTTGIFGLPRFPTGRKTSTTSSNRPSTPTGTRKGSQDDEKETDKAHKDSRRSKGKDVLASPKEGKEHGLLRKRTSSSVHMNGSPTVASANVVEKTNGAGFNGELKDGQNILDQIGEPDHAGWMKKKGERYKTWKSRYFILKGPHLYYLRSNSKTETKIKGYIHIVGYKVTVDEDVDPGRYGFRIEHDQDKTHYFSSDEKPIVREWMKAIMKATIGRDYSKPVISSCNIPTIPLVVAQAMNPAPRPPSPTAREATQKALRRENPNQLSSRDARVLMGVQNEAKDDRARLESVFNSLESDSTGEISPRSPKSPKSTAPPRPSREMRRMSSQRSGSTVAEDTLIEWANSHLPRYLQITDPTGSLCGGLSLFRLAESIKGRPSSPPVPDSAFPVGPDDENLYGLFRLFDFLLDNDVKMGSVSINDVRQGKRDKIVQLLRALKGWEDKRRAIAQSIGKSSVQAGSFVAPISWTA